MTPLQAKDLVLSIKPMLRQPSAPEGYCVKKQILYGPGEDGAEMVCFSCLAVPLYGRTGLPMYCGKTSSFPLADLTVLTDMQEMVDLISRHWLAMVDAPWVLLEGAVHTADEKSLTPAITGQ